MGRKGFLAACLAFVFAFGVVLVEPVPVGAKQLEIAVMVPNGVDPYFTAKRYGYETECENLA